MKILFFLLITSNIFGQCFDYKPDVVRKGIVLASAFLSGASDGLNQTLSHHYGAFKKRHPNANDQFWDPDVSWKNKYRDYPDDKRAAFLGSKTVFAWSTDAFHLTRTLNRSFLVGSLAVNFSDGHRREWYWVALECLAIMGVRAVGFHSVYTLIY